ncbi:MAG TPA: hypothetical protein PLB25_18835, partial [Rhodoferax sp.]|nr:hypothetical protein [Rhodoferax sp.]
MAVLVARATEVVVAGTDHAQCLQSTLSCPVVGLSFGAAHGGGTGCVARLEFVFIPWLGCNR